MLTLERASQLLSAAQSVDSLSAILRAVGFEQPSSELDADTKNLLGLPPEIERASVSASRESLRGLALQCRCPAGFREMLGSVAVLLWKRSPHLLWIVTASNSATGEVALLCWTPTLARLRTMALVARPARVLESDAETLCALAGAIGPSALLTHARWCDVLGREAITRRFFRTLQEVVDLLGCSLSSSLSQKDRRELAIICISRLLFLSFLEAKGWLNEDFGFLSNGYTDCITHGGRYHERVLDPLFFGTLNTRVSARSKRARLFGRVPFLNGGLFTRSHLEKRSRFATFGDEALGNVYSRLLTHYRFTPREESAQWSEASIDPEILGKSFEALMSVGDRKSSGAFYTPQSLVAAVTDEALKNNLSDCPDLHDLSSIRLLDPACGSGAFVVHALERLAAMRGESGEEGSVGDIRRRVLSTSIFGVDTNPMAVWLCELRLWLSVTIDADERDPMKVAPLPNLDRHIRVGDSLAGGDFRGGSHLSDGRGVVALRSRYVRSNGARKRSLARSLDRVERRTALAVLASERTRLQTERRELLIAARSRDLFGDRRPPSGEVLVQLTATRSKIRETRRRECALRDGGALPFSFAAQFSDIASRGGFDIVIGNPPWVRVHNIPAHSRERLRRDFSVYRGAAWQAGAAQSGAGQGFAAQVDLSSLFVERSIALLRDGGVLSFLLPAKLWRSLAGGGVRDLILERTDIVALEDHSDTKQQFEAAVYPSLLVCEKKRRHPESPRPTFKAAVRTASNVVRWASRTEMLPFDDTRGSPWLLVPPDVRESFESVRRAGVPMIHSVFGRPLLGVKTGFNKAFIVRVERVDSGTVVISDGERRASVEREMIRPLVRGETLHPWSVVGSPEHVVCPLAPDRMNLNSLPRLTRTWLDHYHAALAARTDLHGRAAWWSIFRTEAADSSCARVIWADFGLSPRALVLEPGDRTVPLNSCYVARCADIIDARALAVLLNGPLISAWLALIAEPARGGYHRYMGWTMSLLPIPSNWSGVREQLARVAPAGSNALPTRAELLEASLLAYHLRPSDVQPLLSWTAPSD